MYGERLRVPIILKNLISTLTKSMQFVVFGILI